MAGARFVGRAEATRGAGRSSVGMACAHDGFHAIASCYDRRQGLLIYHWTCERCGARLSEARRQPYRPAYDPYGAQSHRDGRGVRGETELARLEHGQAMPLDLPRAAVSGQQIQVAEHL
jgi:hypothetical protein